MRLKRIRAGEYRTSDGAFDIIKDPQSGGECDGWGFVSWLVFAKGDNEPLHLCGSPHCPTLRDARAELERYIATGKVTRL